MDCTCGGNPNCFRCLGTGSSNKKWTKGHIVKSNGSSKRKYKKKNFSPIPKGTSAGHTPCPFCKLSIINTAIERHKKICPMKSYVMKASKSAGKKYKICPHCSSSIREDRFNEHISHNCSSQKRERKQITRVAKKVKKTDKKAKSKHKDSHNPAKPKLGSTLPSYKSQYLLDGSNGLHVARDNGRFGSYSSYDDYGEEANL